MKQITIHGQYTEDDQFDLSFLADGSGTRQNDHNTAMQALRLNRGVKETPDGVMVWDESEWDGGNWN